jgi:NAD(P)H-flavin reductase/hemoglobin-like flavoprotein
VAQYFYAQIFYGHPDVRDMFPVMMDVQRDRLLHALVRIVHSVGSPQYLLPYLKQLGRDHRKFAVVPAHYEVVGRSLIAALARYGGQAWTPEVENAWQRAFAIAARVMVEAADGAAAGEPPWWNAQVVGHDLRTAEIAVLTVRPDQAMRYLPGQYVAVECARRPRLWRPYSMANAARPDGTLEFHVKAVTGGWVSRALVHHTAVGDHLRLGSPVGTMVPDPASRRDVVCVAGSTGLAPIKAIVEDMTRWNTDRNVTVFFGVRRQDALYDLEWLEKLALDHQWLSVVPAVSDDPGFLGALGNIGDVFAGSGTWDNHDVFVCGTADMVRATLARCNDLRLGPSRVRYDSFGPL